MNLYKLSQEGEIRKKVANKLKLHEMQIVRIGAYDNEESRRRWKVRRATADSILSLISTHIDQIARENGYVKLANEVTCLGCEHRQPNPKNYIHVCLLEESKECTRL